MARRILFAALLLAASVCFAEAASAQQGVPLAYPQQPVATAYGQAGTMAYGRFWGGQYNTQDWERFYHYPYVYYPQNYWGQEYYRSAESLYYRYPPEMRTPVYNWSWHNYYPSGQRYHWGHHFELDVF